MATRYLSAVEVAADNMRRRILAGQLGAGATIKIKDLAAEMALSATPVREALKILEREGLVRVAPRSGVSVRRISVDEVLEVYAVKQAVEPLMIRWAMLRGSDSELKFLADFANRLAVLARENRLDDYVAVAEERWQVLLRICRSDVLTAIHHSIDGRTHLMKYQNLAQPGQMRRSSLWQERLAEAIERRQIDLACELTAEFASFATTSLLRTIAKGGGPARAINPLAWPPLDAPRRDASRRPARRAIPQGDGASSGSPELPAESFVPSPSKG